MRRQGETTLRWHEALRVTLKPRAAMMRVVTGASMALLLLAAIGQLAVAQAAVTNGKLAFTVQAGPGDFDIFTMDSGAASGALLTGLPSVADADPAWSPDGMKVAFSSNRDGDFEIFVLDTQAGGLLRLTDNGAFDAQPAWSPDGKNVAYASNRGGSGFDIFIQDAADPAADPKRLTDNMRTDRNPDFSPDGLFVAYESSDDIYVTQVANGAATSLTSSPGTRDEDPDWYGNKIVFTTDRDGSLDIYEMDQSGGSQTPLAANPENEFFPAVTPDYKEIYYTSDLVGVSKIFKMGVDGSNQQFVGQATATADAQPAVQPVQVQSQPPGPGPTGGGNQVPGQPAGSGPQQQLTPGAAGISLGVTRPRLSQTKVNRISKRALYRHLRRGFKGRVTGAGTVEAGIVRVAARCYLVTGERSSCAKTSRRGVTVKGSSVTYRPLGKGLRRLRRLRGGERIRSGRYQLTLKATSSTGETKVFTYKLEVH